MGKIINVKARQIFDSRGNPTVEVDVFTDKDGFGRAAVPSGASTGQHEAVELRDNNEKFLGKGVMSAVNNVNTLIAKSVIGKKVQKQEEIDSLMIDLDGTPNKSNLGANATHWSAADLDFGEKMVQGVLIGVIVIFAFIFFRGLRSGSSFIYDRYAGPNKNIKAPRGFGRTGEKRIVRKRRGYGAPLE